MCLVLNLEGRRPRLRPVVAAGKGAVPAGRRFASTDSRAATAPHALFRVKLVDLDDAKAGRANSPTSAKALAVGALAGSPAADCPPPVRQGPLMRGSAPPPAGRPASRQGSGRRLSWDQRTSQSAARPAGSPAFGRPADHRAKALWSASPPPAPHPHRRPPPARWDPP